MSIASRPLYRRLAHLHRSVSAGDYPNATTLARELEVTTRTVYRDIDFLRTQLRAPLDFCARRRGFFYREAGFALPLFELTEGELIALFLADRLMQHYHGAAFESELTTAYRKLTAGLPDTVTVNLEHLAQACSTRVPDVSVAEAKMFTRLVRATNEGRQLEMVYWTASRDDTNRRTIDPYHLVSIKGKWDLVGYCHLRDERRTFAVNRIQSVKETGHCFERPADFQIEEYLEGSFGAIRGAGPLQTVKLLFTPLAGRYVREKVWHPSQKLRVRVDGKLELSLKVNQLFEVKRWVMSYGADCEVLAPDELRREVAEDLSRAASVYPAS